MQKKTKIGFITLAIILSISLVYAVTTGTHIRVNDGSSITLDGVSSSVSLTVPNQTWLNFNGATKIRVNGTYNIINLSNMNFTIIAKINWSNLTLGWVPPIIGSGNALGGWGGWKITTSANSLNLRFMNASGSALNCALNSTLYTKGSMWDYIFVTYDSLNGINYYQNNERFPYLSSAGCSRKSSYVNYKMNESHSNITIGSNVDFSELFNGSIDYIIVFNKTLNYSDVFNYNSNLPYSGYYIKYGDTGYVTQYCNGIEVLLGGNKSYLSYNYGKDLSETFNFTNQGMPFGLYNDNYCNYFAGFLSNGSIWKTNNGNISDWKVVLNLTSPNATLWENKGMTKDLNGTLYLGQYANGNSGENVSIIWRSFNNGSNWEVAYNGTTSGLNGGRHIHFIQTDPYTGKIYASQGDWREQKKLLRSDNNGTNWTVIMNYTTESNYIDSHPTGVVFFNDRRIFSTDLDNNNGVYITYDDITFNKVFTLPSQYENVIYWMSKDGFDNVYFGTAEAGASSNATIWVSNDKGLNWNKIVELNTSFANYTDAPSNFDGVNGFNVLTTNYLVNIYYYNKSLKDNNYLLKYNINENNGTKIYDSGIYGFNGTITSPSSATWQTDGQTRTLSEGTDYSLTKTATTTVFLITNPSLLYNYFTMTYTLYTLERGSVVGLCGDLTGGIDNFSGYIPIAFSIIGVVFILGFIGTLVYVVYSVQNGTINLDNINIGMIIAIVIGIMIFIFVVFATLFGVATICSIDF